MHHRMILCEEVPLQPWIHQGMQRDLPRTICHLVEHFFWSFQKIYRNLKAKHEHERNWKSCFEEFRNRTMFANLFANDRFVIELSRKHRVVVSKPLVCFLELVPKLYSTDVFFGWANLVYFLNEKCSIFKCEVFFKHFVGSQLNWSQVGDIVVGSCDPDNIRVNAKVEAQTGKRSGQQIESVQTKKKVIKCKKTTEKRTFFLGGVLCRLLLLLCQIDSLPQCSLRCWWTQLRELWIVNCRFHKVTMTNYMTLKCIEIHLKDITVKINDSWNIRIVVDIYNICIYNISIYNCKCKYHYVVKIIRVSRPPRSRSAGNAAGLRQGWKARLALRRRLRRPPATAADHGGAR